MTPAKEPAVYSNLISALMAIIGALVALNVISLLPDQLAAVETAIGAALAILGPTISALLARRASTALVEPRDEDGEPLVRAGGALPQAQARSMARNG